VQTGVCPAVRHNQPGGEIQYLTLIGGIRLIEFYGSTHVGLVRKTNQDCFACAALSDTLAFAVLCDGMGGENGGNIASQIATDHSADTLRRGLHDDMTPTTLQGVMQSAIAGANALVYERAKQDPVLKGMGTTLILAVYWQGVLYIGYVGDSRVYCVSPREELQLTKDHTVVQMLVDIGEITEKDAENHPKRHYITRAVGVAPEVSADFLERALSPDDIVLLCSDGLYHYLEPGSLYTLLRRCAGEKSAHCLIDLANQGGGMDNVTAVVMAQTTPAMGE